MTAFRWHRHRNATYVWNFLGSESANTSRSRAKWFPIWIYHRCTPMTVVTISAWQCPKWERPNIQHTWTCTDYRLSGRWIRRTSSPVKRCSSRVQWPVIRWNRSLGNEVRFFCILHIGLSIFIRLSIVSVCCWSNKRIRLVRVGIL